MDVTIRTLLVGAVLGCADSSWAEDNPACNGED